MTNQRHVWILFLLIIGFVLYWNSFQTPFIWDEAFLIVSEPRIHHGSLFPDIFTKPFLSRSSGFDLYYRPLITLSFRIDYLFWNLNPLGYHLTNLLFHLLNTLLVYALFIRFFKSPALSFFGALLFLAHPAHVEAVTYIPGRVDLIAFFFYLSAFHLYLTGWNSTQKKGSYLFSVLCYTFALLSKEMAVTLPLVILAHAFVVGSKGKRLKLADGIFFLGLLCVTGIWFFVRKLVVFPVPLSLLLDLPKLPLRLMVLPEIMSLYLKFWFFPWPLHMEHIVPIGVLSVKLLVAEWVFFLTFLFGILLLFRKPVERLWLLWIGITLLPVLQIVSLYLSENLLFISEHFVYFASVGLIGLLGSRFGSLIVEEKGGVPVRPAAACALGAVLACFSFSVIWRNGDYRDKITFFEQTVYHAPWSARTYSELGLAYRKVGEPDLARKAFQKALAVGKDSKVYLNLGLLAHDQSDIEGAEIFYRKALALNREGDVSSDGVAYFNLGGLRVHERKWREAIQFYEKAITNDPVLMQAYSNMAYAYWEVGEKEKALQSLERGLAVDPSDEPLKVLKARVEKRLREKDSAMTGRVFK